MTDLDLYYINPNSDDVRFYLHNQSKLQLSDVLSSINAHAEFLVLLNASQAAKMDISIKNGRYQSIVDLIFNKKFAGIASEFLTKKFRNNKKELYWMIHSIFGFQVESWQFEITKRGMYWKNANLLRMLIFSITTAFYDKTDRLNIIGPELLNPGLAWKEIKYLPLIKTSFLFGILQSEKSGVGEAINEAYEVIKRDAINLISSRFQFASIIYLLEEKKGSHFLPYESSNIFDMASAYFEYNLDELKSRRLKNRDKAFINKLFDAFFEDGEKIKLARARDLISDTSKMFQNNLDLLNTVIEENVTKFNVFLFYFLKRIYQDGINYFIGEDGSLIKKIGVREVGTLLKTLDNTVFNESQSKIFDPTKDIFLSGKDRFDLLYDADEKKNFTILGFDDNKLNMITNIPHSGKKARLDAKILGTDPTPIKERPEKDYSIKWTVIKRWYLEKNVRILSTTQIDIFKTARKFNAFIIEKKILIFISLEGLNVRAVDIFNADSSAKRIEQRYVLEARKIISKKGIKKISTMVINEFGESKKNTPVDHINRILWYIECRVNSITANGIKSFRYLFENIDMYIDHTFFEEFTQKHFLSE